MFEAGKKQPVDKAFAQIEDDLRHQYSLGYTPDRQGDDGAYHAIRLTTSKEGVTVQTRDGYYTGGKPERER